MEKREQNALIKDIIMSQKDFHLLPRNSGGLCVYYGNLYLNDKDISILPDNLTVTSDLFVSNNGLTKIPKGLYVYEDLFCSRNNLKSFPDDLIVGHSLFCTHNNITEEIKSNIGRRIEMRDNEMVLYSRIIKIKRIKEKINKKKSK